MLRITTDPHLLTKADQHRWRKAIASTGQRLRPAGATSRTLDVFNLWFRMPIGAEWIAAYRLVMQPDEQKVVVAEPRIFPSVGRHDDPNPERESDGR